MEMGGGDVCVLRLRPEHLKQELGTGLVSEV